MTMRMKVKFDKYWSNYSIVLTVGADPPMKLGMIKYCYSQLDPNTYQEKVDHIKDKLQMLFSEYSKWMSYNQPSGSCSQDPLSSLAANVGGKGKEKIDNFGLYDVLEDWQNTSFHCQNEKSALEQYLDELPLPLKYFPNLDVLKF